MNEDENIAILEGRRDQVWRKGGGGAFVCDRNSLAGSVTQRACAFCGSRVVLYPIADAVHIVHGPIGCAAFNWDIRGSLSSGPQMHRNSYSTDIAEKEVIFGGEKKLKAALDELITDLHPKAAFVYSTCIVGLIGDDVNSICKVASAKHGIPVIPVDSPGFKGTKKLGYQAACDALSTLIGTGDIGDIGPVSINLLGEFNIAGEAWMIREYFEKIGIEVVSTLTGDGRVGDVQRAHGAKLNLVQCSGSMTALAKEMQERFGIPFKRVSFFGMEDTAKAIYDAAQFFGDESVMDRAKALVREEISAVMPRIKEYRKKLRGKKAALYVGGAFKALSLVTALRALGMKTVLAGTQTGNADDYDALREICDPGTIIVDDSNPLELAKFVMEKDVDLFIGGVKERPIAFKLGVAFCDHNHERKIPLAGFKGMLNFAEEVANSVLSPVWKFVPRRAGMKTEAL
ncbi:MAG: nitrogenase iron-molybdenum cofactor biosynthesis protein NifE [Opitutales bacterium]|jgi:nitrogenase molybdenum-cofactor synthesis protein NifE